MDTVYVPYFLKEHPDTELLHHLEVFTNLSAKFTRKMAGGVNTSVNTMKTLLQNPPVIGVPMMNDALNLLKDVVFAYQAKSLTGSGQAECPQAPSTQMKKTTEFKMFPNQMRPALNVLYKSLDATIGVHKALLKKLRDSQQIYVKQYNRLQKLVHKYETGLKTQTNPSETIKQRVDQVTKTAHGLQLEASQTSQKKFGKLRRRMKKQHDLTVTALVRQIAFRYRERKLRTKKLKQIEGELQDMVQDRIAEALQSGIDTLIEFGRRFSLPYSVMKKVGHFDVQKAASQIYTDMSTRYLYPISECYGNEFLLPGCMFETPDLRLQNKQDIRLGSCLDCAQETYVCACQPSAYRKHGASLSFAAGQQMKQKVCSSDGQMAFGWTRLVPGFFKSYGFYPTHSVYLVP